MVSTIMCTLIDDMEKAMQYEIGQRVWVKCVGTDVWVAGVITGMTAKRVRVFNEVRSLEGLYAPHNVKAA